MGKLEGSSSFLPPDNSSSDCKKWGFVIEAPYHRKLRTVDVKPKQCPNCFSYLSLANGLCPICQGNLPPEVNSKFVEDYRYIPEGLDIENNKRVIALIWDLNISGPLLQQVISSFMNDKFLEKYNNDYFMLILVASSPIYVSKQNGYIHLQHGYINQPFSNYKLSANEITEVVEQIFILLAAGGIKYEHDSTQIYEILSVLNDLKTNIAILFYDTKIPQIQTQTQNQQTYNFALHCINVISSDKQEFSFNILKMYENKWTHAIIKKPNPSIGSYIASILDRRLPVKCKTNISFSGGIQSDWISTPYEQIFRKNKMISFTSSFYSLYTTYMGTIDFTSQYKQRTQFRIQVASHFDDGSIYISTYLFKKAPALQEYLESFNFSNFVTIMIRQFANNYFASLNKTSFIMGIFDKKLNWDINSIYGNLITQQFAKTSYHRFLQIVSQNSPLPTHVKEIILYSAISCGVTYIYDLINSLLTNPKDETISIVPFMFINKGSQLKGTLNISPVIKGGSLIIVEEVSPQIMEYLRSLLNTPIFEEQ